MSTGQTPAEIEAEIEQQREQLAGTIDALTAKLDVKGNTKAKVADVRATTQAKVADAGATTRLKAGEVRDLATTDQGKPRPEVLAGAAALVIVVVGLVWWSRR